MRTRRPRNNRPRVRATLHQDERHSASRARPQPFYHPHRTCTIMPVMLLSAVPRNATAAADTASSAMASSEKDSGVASGAAPGRRSAAAKCSMSINTGSMPPACAEAGESEVRGGGGGGGGGRGLQVLSEVDDVKHW